MESIKDATRSRHNDISTRPSTMTDHRNSRSFVRKCVFLTLLLVVVHATAEECDQSKCSGPLKYYKSLGCTPVYENPGDCCAKEYDCNHLKELDKDKCYANGHEYNIGDMLKDEDRNPCDFGCMCRKYDEVASFICAATDCGLVASTETCYSRNSPDQCCPGPHVCLEEGEKMPTCEVDGKTYKDGEYFTPESDPELDCYCGPGYKGENVAPFCKKPNRPYCSPVFQSPGSVYEKCVPVFYDLQNPQTDCSYATRCPNLNDTVIQNNENTKTAPGSDKMCEFGNMTLRVGDELNQGTNFDSVCVKCVCEVPPIPTCRRLPDAECDHSASDGFHIIIR